MVRLTHVAVPLTVGLFMLTGCPGDDIPSVDTDPATTTGADSTTTDNPPPQTTTGVDDTTTTDPDSSSGGGMACEPACENGQCCVEGLCFDPVEPNCDPGCSATEVCMCPEGSDPCDCTAECMACGTDEPSYDPCLDTECPEGTVCLADNPADPTFAVCAATGCGEDSCACPLPPDSGNAVNTCGNFAGDNGDGSCFLDCSADDAECPDGMLCRLIGANNLCVWPGDDIASDCCAPNGTPGCDDMTCQDAVCGIDAFCCSDEWDGTCASQAQLGCTELCPGGPEPLPPYGDCVNDGAPCPFGETCITDGAATFGWCGLVPCTDVGECAENTLGGTAPVACNPINEDASACMLDCSVEGSECPEGMSCLEGANICVWNFVPPGYSNCGIDESLCDATEVCLADTDKAGVTTWAVCGQDACTEAAECVLGAPDGGDAPVACGDPTGAGGDNQCYLDCSGGQTCPDGMQCTDDTLCTWPQGTVTFSEDFETGDFSAGWTVVDVDGQTPNKAVADLFTDAWIVTDATGSPSLVAASTSWYEPVGQSDDWLISPQITLGPNSSLVWISESVDPGFPDGFELRISTAGPDVADFLGNPILFETPAEAAAPTVHVVDLAAAGYADQDVYVAWRNITNDGFILTVDNVQIQEFPAP